jgi:NAD(P)H-flavin reductase
MDILFKIYRPNENHKFPNGGKLTPYIETLKVGDLINIEGPYGRFGYEENGTVIIDEEKMPMKRLFFMAGGSGITPCYQTIV